MQIIEEERKDELNHLKNNKSNNGVEHNSKRSIINISTYSYGSNGRRWFYLSKLNHNE
ncbi:MAG: hypothetical protein ACFE85_13350 [Candidatus Hodarchaeota archaeon]